MRLLPSRFLLRSRLGFSCVLLAAVCLLGACNRHSAEEVPEGYGHGSSRDPNFHNHQIDSKANSSSFSDTQGTEKQGEHPEGDEPEKKASGEAPQPSQPGRFFPSGS